MTARPGIDFLVVSPPATTPAEPPSGAYLLAGGLRARGYSAPLLDLSIEFYEKVLRSAPGTDADRALAYLRSAADGFSPSRHRTEVGVLHSALRSAESRLDGWKLTLMDMTPPCCAHSPGAILGLCESGGTPLEAFWEEALASRLDELRPARVLVSVAYLSQLAAAIDLCRFLRRRKTAYSTGGSLPNSLGLTGRGSHLLEGALGPVMPGDGSVLVGEEEGAFLGRVVAPELLASSDYFSPAPIVPYALSSGCCWSRCLFCPDRGIPFRSNDMAGLERFLASVPARPGRRTILHLLDSAVPPGVLREALPLIGSSGVSFFGFARPSRALVQACPPAELAAAGCLMLQLGAESGSDEVLGRFDKGFVAAEWAEVVRAVAAGGIRTYLYLLFGLPGETDGDRDATVDAVEDLGTSVDFLNLSLFNLPRSSELARRAGEFGISILPDSERDEPHRIALYSEFTVGGRIPRREARLYLSRSASRRESFHRAMVNTPRWLRAAHPAQMMVEGRIRPGLRPEGTAEATG